MPSVHDQDDKWTVLDALVRHTVHCVLFQERASGPLESEPMQQQVAKTKATSEPKILPALLVKSFKSVDGDDASVQYAAYCKRVFECQHWTNARLQQEKRALKAYLQLQYQHNNQQLKEQTQVSTELYCAHEAYALLKLFLLERKAVNNASSLTSSLQQQKPRDNDRFLLRLHVQLELYSKYFEHAQQRKCWHAFLCGC